MVGKTLGPYKIIEPLGKGGMGEVYLGEDTRLGRKVAIKVLPAEFASDPERLARFEQEARAAAALNHPHIAVIHDVGFEAGAGGETATEAATDPDMDLSAAIPSSGVHYMVQEYLEGETLRQPLMKGALPLEKALLIGAEMAEGLAAAHAAGIIHRDLKPDNIFITKEGHAKILDFGLAKLTEAAPAMSPSGEASKSPTMIGTVAGQVMGTAGYMAPEQVQGDGDIDHRADLFAFGCVLYEMTSGRQPFTGKNIIQTLDRIVNEQPETISAINPALPARLQWMLEKCLAKEPGKRYQDAADLTVDLKSLRADMESGTLQPLGTPLSAGEPLAAAAAAVPMKLAIPAALAIAIGVMLATWLIVGSGTPDRQPVQRWQFDPPAAVALVPDVQSPGVAISPDGTRLAYNSVESGARVLGLRELDSLEARAVSGLIGGAEQPFFSPDGEWIGFIDDARDVLMKVPAPGGPALVIAELQAGLLGATWGADDTIVFTQTTAPGGLWRVAAGGGEPEVLTTPDPERGEGGHFWPHFLPGGDALLFTIFPTDRNVENAQIALLSMETGEYRVLVSGGANARYSPTGHIVYGALSTLRGVGFDLDSLTVTSDPVPLVADVETKGLGGASFDFSEDGTLVYVEAQGITGAFDLVWVDRSGRETPIRTYQSLPTRPRLSPDNSHVALEVISADDGATDIRVYDLERGSSIQLSHAGGDFDPVWTLDGERIVFSSNRGDYEGLYWRRANGAGAEELLPHREMHENAYSWSPDGNELAVYTRQTGAQRDVWVLSRDDDWSPTPILTTEFNERSPAFSPDGEWLAYASDESGRDDVYVLSYPDLNDKYVISTDGGREPAWSADGSELFYRHENGFLSVAISTDPEFRAGRPELLFTGTYRREVPASGSRSYDVATDGRFILVRPSGTTDDAPKINVVVNWFEELKERLPAGR